MNQPYELCVFIWTNSYENISEWGTTHFQKWFTVVPFLIFPSDNMQLHVPKERSKKIFIYLFQTQNLLHHCQEKWNEFNLKTENLRTPSTSPEHFAINCRSAHRFLFLLLAKPKIYLVFQKKKQNEKYKKNFNIIKAETPNKIRQICYRKHE